jgi:hypothetical protein
MFLLGAFACRGRVSGQLFGCGTGQELGERSRGWLRRKGMAGGCLQRAGRVRDALYARKARSAALALC